VLALFRVLLDPRVLAARQPRALQKALDRRLGRADARTLALLNALGLFGGKADDVQREPAWRRKTLRALIEQATLDQRAGDEAFQVLGALALHARGDFFAEQFEQEVGHPMTFRIRCSPSAPQAGAPPPAVLSQAAPQALASSRTRRM